MNQKKKRRLWKGHIEIFKMLLEEPLTYSELKERTDLSDSNLSGFLQDLEDQGKIFKKPAKRRSDEKYTTFEMSSENFNNQLDKHSELARSIKRIPHSVKDFVQVIRFMKDSKGAEEAVIRANVMLLTAWIPDLIYNSLHNEPEDVHRCIDELIDSVAKPWIHSLFELGLVYKDLAEKATLEVRDTLHTPALEECERYSEITKVFPKNTHGGQVDLL